MTARLLIILAASLIASQTAPPASAGAPAAASQPHPAATAEFRVSPEVSTGVGAVVGINNPNRYLKAPLVVALHSPPARLNFPLLGPTALSGTAGILIEPILRGVETRHVAVQIGPRFRFGKEGAPLRLFADFRGGVGITDSGSTPGGQGQDLCFNAFSLFGIEITPRAFSDRAALWLGILYTHVSNAGLSEPERPNDGLDSLGAAGGAIWKF